MAKGPFGNPLSTGIALSGVIDMVTPVRQAQERKRKRQAEEKAAQDKRAKELGSIMGKIAIDEDKIWWRYHDDARSQYANTIDKVQQMYSAGDYAGMYKTINDFDSRMANYTQATTLKNKRREELAKGKYYMDSNLENMSENRDVDNEEYGKLLAESGYGAYGEDGMFSYMPNAEIYDIKNAWERELKGEKQLLITEGEKAITQVGKTPSGVIAQKDYNPSVITNAQQRIRSDIYSNPYRGARILEKNGYDVSSLESITDPTQRAEKTLEMFDDYIMKNRPGVDQQVLNVRAAEGGGFSFNVGGGRSEGSIFNKSGGRELKLAGGDALKTTGQYDITFTKGTGRTTLSVPSGSYVLDPTTGEYKETGFTGALEDAIPLYPMVGEDGQEWYAAISKGSVSDVDPNMIMIITNLLSSGDAGDAAEAQKMLDKSKYGQTYLIKGNGSVKNQFWGKVLGQDYTKQRANEAMEKLGGLPEL